MSGGSRWWKACKGRGGLVGERWWRRGWSSGWKSSPPPNSSGSSGCELDSTKGLQIFSSFKSKFRLKWLFKSTTLKSSEMCHKIVSFNLSDILNGTLYKAILDTLQIVFYKVLSQLCSECWPLKTKLSRLLLKRPRNVPYLLAPPNLNEEFVPWIIVKTLNWHSQLSIQLLLKGIHSKSKKVCGTAFSVKKNCGKSAGYFWAILGHI